MRGNPASQGYCLADDRAVAGFTSRHPFDVVWNGGVVAACTSATVFNFCLPAAAFARISKRRARHPIPA